MSIKSFSMKTKLVLFLLLALMICAQTVVAQPTGTISGKIVDAETGDALIGVNVVIEGTMWGGASDLSGSFVIKNIPVGKYNLVASYIGYSKVTISDVNVLAGQVAKMDFSMAMEVIGGEEVIVTAKAVKNTEASLLKNRLKAQAVSDAISAEAITRSGSGDAAEAMKQVTGASVVDGKYVFVRGLGDRYTSTQLNGAELPSTDPYKRSGSIDLIPSNLVDNIVTAKSFTPDKPGDFSGGTVDIVTKDFPDQFTMSFSAGTSYNSQVHLTDGSLGYNGSSSDWLGMDSGDRDIPEILKEDDVEVPNSGAARQDPVLAQQLHDMTHSFNKQMRPSEKQYPLNQSYSFSVGNQVDVLNRPFGFLTSFTYSKNASSYSDGDYGRYTLGSGAQEELVSKFDLKDTRSSEEVLWGTLLKASYKWTPKHVISLNGLYNQNGESKSRWLEGSFPYDLGEDDVFQTSAVGYSERTLKNLQLSGDHQFDFLLNSRINWKATGGNSIQDEPDLRFFTSYYTPKDDGSVRYGIKQNVPPQRFFRYLDENKQEFTLDWAVPFKQWSGRKGQFKIGGLYSQKDRNYNERLFKYSQDPKYNYNGNYEDMFSLENAGVIDTTRWGDYEYYKFGLYLIETNTPASTYEADGSVSASYAMIDLPITSRLRFIGGARYEETELNVVTKDTTKDEGHLNTYDLLPSLNFIYALTEKMNVRLAYSTTLARPTFREIAPYASFDFLGGDTFIGNPNLKRTLINNIDLRWEWFSRPGEIYAISAFHKTFDDPIERVIVNADNRELTLQNVDAAQVMGLELETRKKLDVFHSSLSNWLIGANASFIQSEVDIAAEELEDIRQVLPDAKDKRVFQGQSPYLFNINLTYDNYEKGMVASLYYNVFGERLYAVSAAATPDAYEQPANMLNFSFSYKLAKNLKLKFGVKNILDTDIKVSQEYKGKEYIYSRYNKGRSISLGLGYSL